MIRSRWAKRPRDIPRWKGQGAMFIAFFEALKAAGVPVSVRDISPSWRPWTATWPAGRWTPSIISPARASCEGRSATSTVSTRSSAAASRGWSRRWAKKGSPSRGVAAQARREAPHRRGEGRRSRPWAASTSSWRAAQEAARGAEGAPSGRLQMDRHRRHLPLRRLWLQSRGRAHRAGRQPQLPRGEGVGQARVQGSRRRGRAWHPQLQGGPAPPAQVRPQSAPPTNWTSTAPSARPPARAIST